MAITPNPIIFTNPGSLKPHKGRSFKRARRIEIVARLEAAFIPDIEIANHLGLTVQAIYAIKSSPEYLAKRVTHATGVLSKYDAAALATDEAKKDAVDELGQLALNSIRNVLLDKNHKDHARVALDLLDRNQATAKISKMQHSVSGPTNMTKENAAAQELLAMLSGFKPEPEPEPVATTLAPDFVDEDGI